MKKSLYLAAILFASFGIYSCNSQPEEESTASETKRKLEELSQDGGIPAPPAPPEPPAPPIVTSLLFGKWQVDSAGFENNGVRDPLSKPLVDTYWEFTKDGKLIFSGNIANECDITIVNNRFVVRMMNTEMDYKITSLTANDLEIMGEIGDIEKTKMASVAKLKRVR
jgi:hypothetical protein